MKKNSKTFFAVFAVFALVILLFSGCFPDGTSSFHDYSDINRKMALMQKYFEMYSIYDFDEESAKDWALRSFMGGLHDKYAYYFSEEEMKAFQDDFMGQSSDLGMEVWYESQILNNALFVYRVSKNSPAYDAGIKAGDRIVSVNGISLYNKDYDEVVDGIFGEAGNTVDLEVLRGEEKLTFSLVRSEYTKTLVEYEMIDDIALIRIYEFATVTASQLKNCLLDVIDEEAKGIIFDVRNNPGGDYDSITGVLNLLLPDGELIVTRKFDSREDNFYSKGEAMTDIPLAVIANRNSASAAELFVSCLRDTLNVPFVGQTTYGKSVGQSIINFDDGTGMKFTTFVFLTKNKVDFNDKGLVPDYEVVVSDTERMSIYSNPKSEDSQLQKAIEVLSDLIEK